jgi:hypothetical protein
LKIRSFIHSSMLTRITSNNRVFKEMDRWFSGRDLPIAEVSQFTGRTFSISFVRGRTFSLVNTIVLHSKQSVKFNKEDV